jgi:hypothetical protein
MAQSCYVATKSTQGRWYSQSIKQRNHDQETRFINFVKQNHDADARNQGWNSNFKPQSKDDEVNFGPRD